MKALICLAVAAFVLIGLGCSDAPTATPITGSIVGKVRLFDEFGVEMPDKSGATIMLLGTRTYTTTSKIDGSYRFDNIDAGIYRLAKSAPNHNTDTTPQIQFVGNGTLDVNAIIGKDFQRAWYGLICTVRILNERGQETANSSGLQIRIFNDKGTSYIFDGQLSVRISSIPNEAFSVIATKNDYEYDSTKIQIDLSKKNSVILTVFKLPKTEITLTMDNIYAATKIDTSISRNIDTVKIALHGTVSDAANIDLYELQGRVTDSVGKVIENGSLLLKVVAGQVIFNQTFINDWYYNHTNWPFQRFKTYNIQFIATSIRNSLLVNKRLPNPNNNTSISMSNTLKVVVP